MFRRQLDSELAYLPREFLAGFSAASVLINSVANLGGFAGPYAIGAVGRTREVSYTTKLEINPKRILEVNSMSRPGPDPRPAAGRTTGSRRRAGSEILRGPRQQQNDYAERRGS